MTLFVTDQKKKNWKMYPYYLYNKYILLICSISELVSGRWTDA